VILVYASSGIDPKKGVIGMTIEQVSQRILNQFIVPASSLLLISVVIGVMARGAEFIINQFQRRNITTQEIGGKRRGEIRRT
jgi:hypothetical protein